MACMFTYHIFRYHAHVEDDGCNSLSQFDVILNDIPANLFANANESFGFNSDAQPCSKVARIGQYKFVNADVFVQML